MRGRFSVQIQIRAFKIPAAVSCWLRTRYILGQNTKSDTILTSEYAACDTCELIKIDWFETQRKQKFSGASIDVLGACVLAKRAGIVN